MGIANLEVLEFSIAPLFSISFHFAHASMMTTVDSKVINILNREYFNKKHTLLFIYKVIDSDIII